MFAIGVLARLHGFEQLQIFFNTAVAIRSVDTCLLQCATASADFVSTLAVNIGIALYDQIYRILIDLLEII